MHRSVFLSILLISASLFFPTFVGAQTADSLGKEGQEAFAAGNYEEAAKKFQEFIQQFPDQPTVDVARYFAGLSLYALQKNAEAIPLLLAASQTKNEDLNQGDNNIVPDCLFYLAKAYQALGSTLTVPSEKNDAFKKSVETYNQLLEKFPDSGLKSEALLGRAVTFVQLREFARAQTDLEALKAADPNNPLNADIDYMLGYVFSEQAQALVNEFKQDEANEVIARARTIYTQLAESPNLAVANEARFQLGNLLFNEQRFEEARKTFRTIRSKNEIIASQEEIVRRLQTEVQGATNKAARDQLTRALQRERDKLNEAKTNPELAVSALLRIGDTFMAERLFDQARVMFRYAQPFAEEEQKKAIEVQIIISLALQGKANKANEAFAKFRSQFPNDPVAETVEFSIGVAQLQQGRFEEALKSFNESLKNFPESRVAPQVPSMIARTYLSMNKPDDAIKSYDDFISRAEKGELKVPPETIERARKDQAFALFQVGRADEAIAAMKKLSETARTEDVRQDAAYQTGTFLMRGSKFAEAGAAFQDFVQKYPEHPLAPTAAFTLVTVKERLNKPDESIAAARAFLEKFKAHPLAPRAYERIWKSHLARKEYEPMKAAQAELFAAFPDSEFTVFALWDQAKVLEDEKDLPGAMAAYSKVYDQFAALKAKGSASAENTTVRSFAGFALNRAATIRQRIIRDLGNPANLDEAGLAQWKELNNVTLADMEKVITQTREPRAIQNALRLLNETLIAQVNTNQIQRADAINLLSRLAGGATPDVALQIQIARATLAFDLGLRQQAVEYYAQAMNNPDAKPSWQDLERYGDILLESNQWDEALKVFTRIQTEFSQDKASAPVAIYGIAAAQLGQGKVAEAGELFKKLKTDFPNSPRVYDAAYGEGLGLAQKGEFEKAFELWRDVLRNPRASNRIKARTLVSYGEALLQMAEKNITPEESKRTDGKPPTPTRELAVSYFNRVDLLFEAEAEIAAEGLYNAWATSRKIGKNDEAGKYLQTLQTKYPTSSWAVKARQ